MADAAAWARTAEEARGCTACPLAATRTLVVPGDLPAAYAGALLLGEGPGADEDRAGHPFVGRSGRLLDAGLAAAGLSREQVAVTNVVKCRPPGNRTPRAGEARACRGWTERLVAAADPAVVVALGATAARWFLGPAARLAELRGRRLAWQGRTLLVTYHPSAALRFGPGSGPDTGLRADLLGLAGVLAEAGRG